MRSLSAVRRGRSAAVVAVAALTLGACGGSDSSSSETPTTDAAAPVAEAEPVAAVLENSPQLATVGEALPQLENGVPDPVVGSTAPVMTGQTFDGSEISIGGATDGPTMLVFLAHWCPHCNDEIPQILQLETDGDLPSDLNVVGVSTAVASDRPNFPPSEWIDDKGWDWPVLADTESAEAFRTFGGSGFPFAVMLDADGNVLARKSGSGSAAQIKEWIDASLPAQA